MCGSVASLKPTGTKLSMLKANWPTALVPALSRSCATALSKTPVSKKPKVTAVMGGVMLNSRLSDDQAPGIAGNYFIRQLVLVEILQGRRVHDGERAAALGAH